MAKKPTASPKSTKKSTPVAQSSASKKPTPPAKKSRSVVPIQSTIETIKGYPPKLVIFKIPASDNYWVRYHDGKPIKRSTGTTNKAAAKDFAKQFFDDIVYNKRHGISNVKSESSFMTCAKGVIAENEVAVRAGELSASYVRNQKLLIQNYIFEYFDGMDIQVINYQQLNGFKVFLLDKECKSATLKTHFAALKKIFNYAEKVRLIQARPHFPKLKSSDDDARAPFTEAEYKLLCQTLDKKAGAVYELKQQVSATKVKKIRNIYITKELRYLVGFMVYTFIRPSDIKTIQHKHIERRSKKRNYLFMPIPETKKHGKAIVSMPNAVYYYNKLLALRAEQGITVTPDDYVFGHGVNNRDTAYRDFTRQFDQILNECDLKNCSNGVNRSMYSLRHTSLLFLAKRNPSLDRNVMAKNARTSSNMLERFYLSKLENSDLADALHNKVQNKKVKPKKASKLFTNAVDVSLKDFANAIDPKKGNKQVVIAKDGSLQIKKD